jgi:hypothetical protein
MRTYLVLCLISVVSTAGAQVSTGVLLPDGREFISWERPLQFSRTYYVDNRNPRAADTNPGTKELPFLTINHAAQVLQPGERVVIMEGVYREAVEPARGGSGPDRMISYEAAPGAKVVVKGSRLVKGGWQPSSGFSLRHFGADPSKGAIYQLDLRDLDYQGYNPFGMASIMMDRHYLFPTKDELDRHLARRGLVFVDGQRLKQVTLYHQLAAQDGAYWVEHNGLTLHLRLPGDAHPAGHQVELAIQEQIFAPRVRGLAYLRVKGITFEHAANGFPVPQRGAVSMSAGHHWIIEDCTIRGVNALGLDIGMQDWNSLPPEVIGYAIVRRNHIEDAGACGLAGMRVRDTLIESNLIENVGWHNVELMWETAGIKLHRAVNCLIRNNVIRHIEWAPGLWLDYENANTRATANVIGDVREVHHGCLYLEASHEPNMFDHNILWNSTPGKGGGTYHMTPHGGWGILTDGSDEVGMAHNLIGLCQDAAIKTRTAEGRVVSGRGGTSRWNRVLNNIFYRCGKAIDFSHKENFAEGNLYWDGRSEVADEEKAEGRGLNWISGPEPALKLDLGAWQKYFGFDKTGAYGDMEISVDLDRLEMTWTVRGAPSELATLPHFARDFQGRDAGSKRPPGPFAQLPGQKVTISIDPRGIPR